MTIENIVEGVGSIMIARFRNTYREKDLGRFHTALPPPYTVEVCVFDNNTFSIHHDPDIGDKFFKWHRRDELDQLYEGAMNENLSAFRMVAGTYKHIHRIFKKYDKKTQK